MNIIKDFRFFLKNKKSIFKYRSDKSFFEEQIETEKSYFLKHLEKIYYALTKEKYCDRMDFGWFCDNLVKIIKENNVNVIVELDNTQYKLKEVQNKLSREQKAFESQKSEMQILTQEIDSLENENYILKEKHSAYLNLESYTKKSEV